jgi:hypothetical protein
MFDFVQLKQTGWACQKRHGEAGFAYLIVCPLCFHLHGDWFGVCVYCTQQPPFSDFHKRCSIIPFCKPAFYFRSSDKWQFHVLVPDTSFNKQAQHDFNVCEKEIIII